MEESQPPPLSSTSAPLVDPPLHPVSPRSQLRGPRPPPLRISKDSLRLRKPKGVGFSTEPILLPKDRFCPTDQELIEYYLKPKVQNKPLTADVIGEVDVYKYEPWDLPPQARICSDSQWYFFSRPHKFNKIRISRATEKGYWRPGSNKQIWKDGKFIGLRKILVYHRGRHPYGERTNWVIHEYQLEDKEITKDSHVLLCLTTETVSNIVEELGYLPIDFQQVDKVLEPLQTSSLVDGSLIYGRENDKRIIVNLILSHVFKDSNPAVICIVAASGFGKSTMLHLLYNDQSVRDAFDKRVFMCMSEGFDEGRLMKEVLQSLTCSFHDIDEPSILEDIVKEELMEKKLLLVLDNAENQNQSFWSYVSMLINAGAKGSLALVTKQTEMVGGVMEGMHIHHLENLSYYHCWAILKHHAFGGCDQNVSPELEKIGKLLLSKCNYNPFCIRVLGSLLSHSVNKDWWIDILENGAWKTSKFRGDILPAIRVCYHYMPSHLKNCFSYCSLFPRDYILPKHYIIRLWISQGFILSVEGREPEDIGIQYFDELVQRSFFQHCSVDNAKRDKFVMHELIHGLAENVSGDSCFRSEDGICNIPDVSHFSLACSEPQTIQLEHLVEEVRDLHTCLFVNRSKFQMDGVFPIVTLVGLNDLFRTFSSITALDLSYTNVAELPGSIGLLRGLRFLGINNTKVKHLPRELFSLVNIRTIEARNCGRLVGLPEEISQLTNLRYLDVWKESGHVLMPLGIGKLINLQNLETFNIGNDSIQAKVGELKSLNSLGSHLRITGLENVRSIDDAIEATLKNKSKIEALTLQWSGSVQYGRGEADVTFTEELLKNLEPNDNLQELIVKNYTGAQFPAWIGDSLFSKLVSIILDSCFNCKKFPDLSKLPTLKSLSLRKIRGVQTLDSTRKSPVKRFPMFQSLELLNLWEMYDLEELFEVQNGDFPHLHAISINRCSVLKKVPLFPSLVELSFHSCARLPEIANLPSLEFLKVENFRSLKQLDLRAKLTVLKRLELSNCSELLSVFGLLKMTSIEKILLNRCPKIDLLHNHEQYNFKRVNVTRLRQEMHRLDRSGLSVLKIKIADDTYIKLKKIVAEIEALKWEAYQESNRRKKAELDLILTNRKLNFMRSMHNAEKQKRAEIEDKFARQGNEWAELKRMHAQTQNELMKATGLMSSLESENMQLNQTVKAKFQEISALFEELKQERDIAPTEASELNRPGLNSHVPTNCMEFTYSEIKDATNNFDQLHKIGEGRYGVVYRGFLRHTIVAIKILSRDSIQEDQLFYQEIEILSRIRHPHMVTLIGACVEARALVYEYLPLGSLDNHLNYKGSNRPLSWQSRIQVALQICSALIFLHSSLVVHGDLKPKNVLLDSSYMTKLCDFGICRQINLTSSTRMPYHITQQPKGTLAYMDPEYLSSGELTPQYDVFSFGIVLLQLVTGKEAKGLRNSVEVQMEQKKIKTMVDPSAGWPLEQAAEMIQIGLWCSEASRRKRPDLAKDVWARLESIGNVTSASMKRSLTFRLPTFSKKG